MNPKIWIPLAAALITGSVAAWTGYELVSRRPRVAEARPLNLSSVVVAARPVPAGRKLSSADLSIIRVEPGAATADAFSNPEDLVGRVTASPLKPGQIMSTTLLATQGAGPGLGALLPAGYRAITLKVDRYSGLQGFIHPEARVDIVGAFGNGDSAAARVVAQNVRVMAVEGRLVGQAAETEGNDAAALSSDFNVTLMVTPEQAAAIQLAAGAGMPRLTLRAGNDDELHPFLGLTLAELRGEALADPFAMEPWPEQAVVIPESSPESPPTTRPSGETFVQANTPTTRPARPPLRQHAIEVIRGGVTSRVIVPAEPAPRGSQPEAPPDSAYANTDTTPAGE